MAAAERWFAGLLVLTGVVAFAAGLDLPTVAIKGGPGPGFMPRGLALLLIILSGIYLANLFRTSANYTKRFTSFDAVKRQAFFTSVLIGSVILTYVLGMLISLGFFIAVTLITIEKVAWTKSVGVTVLTILAVHLVLERWLGLQLIKGLFM